MSSIGRNDPCHCGSGKKYKKCCLSTEEAPQAKGMAQVRRMTADDLRAFINVPDENCWACGQPVNPFGISGFGDEEIEPDGVTMNLGDRTVTVHGKCLPQAKQRVIAERYSTPKGEFREWTWCLHCECVHRTEKWVANNWRCPGPDCDGNLVDAHDFQAPTGWPAISYLSSEDPTRYVYLENPTDGGYYPLYPHWKDEEELQKIGTRGRWVDQVWVPEHPVEYRRIDLPGGGSVEGLMQLRRCQVCSQEAYCTVQGCWDCRKTYCINCEDGFGKCKECARL